MTIFTAITHFPFAGCNAPCLTTKEVFEVKTLSGFTTKLLGAYLFDEVLANRICGNTCYVFELQSVMARCINLKGADPRIWGPDGFRVLIYGKG